jgi:hypothetical protein
MERSRAESVPFLAELTAPDRYSYGETAPKMFIWIEADITALSVDYMTGALDKREWSHSYQPQGGIGWDLEHRVCAAGPMLGRVFFLPDALPPFRTVARRFQGLAARPYHEVRGDIEQLRKETRKDGGPGVFGFDAIEDFSTMLELVGIADAKRRLTNVGIAVAAYKHFRGEYPQQLVHLEPDFMAEIPLDPFGGASMKLRVVDRGILVYSVGPDGHDDLGQPYSFTGFVPTYHGDVVVFLAD